MAQPAKKDDSKVIKLSWINENTQADNAPRDEESEKALLGALLVAGANANANAHLNAIDYLRAEDFYYLRNAYIYRAMQVISERDDTVDIISVASELQKHRKDGQSIFDLIGGQVYLTDLTTTLGTNVDTYAMQIKRSALSRSMMQAGDLIKALGADTKKSLPQKADEALHALQDVQNQIATIATSQSTPVSVAVDEAVERIIYDMAHPDEAEVGFSTGYPILDEHILCEKSKLYTIGAYTSVGKSAFLLSLFYNALKQGKRAIFFTLEMSLNQMVTRLLAIETGIPPKRISRRILSREEVSRLQDASGRIMGYINSDKCHIIELNMPTMADMQMHLRRLVLSEGIDVCYIDYVHPDKIRYSDDNPLVTQQQRMTAYVAEIETWKKRFDIPIFIASQCGRDSADRPPRKQDLFASSLIEYTSDVIILIDRPSQYDHLADPHHATIEIAKVRDGANCVKLDFYFNTETIHFSQGRIETTDLLGDL